MRAGTNSRPAKALHCRGQAHRVLRTDPAVHQIRCWTGVAGTLQAAASGCSGGSDPLPHRASLHAQSFEGQIRTHAHDDYTATATCFSIWGEQSKRTQNKKDKETNTAEGRVNEKETASRAEIEQWKSYKRQAPAER